MLRLPKKLIHLIVISCLSGLTIFGYYQIADAPFKQSSPSTASPAQFSPLEINKETSFIFGGDVMLSRQVNEKMHRYQDYGWPFAKIASTLAKADLTIINLEAPFSISRDYRVDTGSFSFKADPKAIAGLLDAGIDLVSLANNHILNQGSKGLTDTFKILDEKGIKYIGAGNNESEARQGEIIEINEQKFAFLAYAYPEDNSVAGPDNPGIANLDIEKMIKDVRRLKAQGAKVIVIMHAGTEYTSQPNKQQINFARKAIEAGAEAVIGHHPHWPQNFEFYQDKPIIYSLGNLIFDQMWSKETQQGLLAKLTWNNGWQRIELIPIKIKDYGQAEILPDGPEKTAILRKIGAPEDGLIKK